MLKLTVKAGEYLVIRDEMKAGEAERSGKRRSGEKSVEKYG